MIHVLSLFQSPKTKTAKELEAARSRFASAYREHCAADERQDTRRLGAAAAALRQANVRLMQAERAYDEVRA